MEQNKKVSIIIVTYNKLEYNKGCIDSIRKYTNYEDYELIVVDNNSTDGTKEWLQEQNDIKLVLNKDNEGFTKGCNIGIGVASEENDILLLNNDTLVTYKWLDNLKECLYSNDKIGAVGPITNYASTFQCIDVPYKSIDEMYGFAYTNNTTRGQDYEEVVFIIGFCMLIKREVLNKVGLCLDEIFSPGNYEDNDLCVRIQQQGYKIYLCHNTFIHHFGSVSFVPGKYDQLLATNKAKFIEKWGFNSDISLGNRFDLISNVYEPWYKELNILQYNCGLGCDLLKLKYIFKNAQLYGIEKNKYIASVSKNYINISTESIEDLEEKFNNTKFDYIILGDISEDYIGLDSLINNTSKYLKQDGYIVVSVENSMCFSVVKGYLLEQITPQKLLKDRKNLFTKDEVLKIFSDNGFVSISMIPYNIWVSEEDRNLMNMITSYSVDKSIDKYLAYRYIGKFKKI